MELKEKKHENVKLKEEDASGAILPREKPKECFVKQLQRWLPCRGAKTTRNKTQFVQSEGLADREVPEVIWAQKTQQLTCLVIIQGGGLTRSPKQSHK